MSAKVTVTGNLGSDPEVRYTRQGDPVINLSIGATPRRPGRRQGEWVDNGEPLWIEATLWGDIAKTVAELAHKGDRVSVSGTLVLDSYESREGKRTSLTIPSATWLGATPKAQK